jgi:signal transduction histidine kinase
VADQTAVALQNARLVTDLRASNEEIRALNEELGSRNEQLREMDKVKTDFITIASHELRTPLTQILGFADLLKMMSEAESIPGAEVAPLTESVLSASHRLSDVVTQMLEVSQLDVDALQLKPVESSLEKMIQQAAESFVPAIKERRLFFSLKNISNLPLLQVDPDRMAQALRNIISNAIKFTPDGGAIELRGRLIRQPRQPELVEVVVADTGIGVAPEHLELIFEKFFRVGGISLHSTSPTKFMGAGPGLGLPIAKGIIEAHGGRIWAESLGLHGMAGTQIHIVVPVKAVAVTEKQARAFVGM